MPYPSRPAVWIVDDNANIRASVKMVLEFEGYAVESFESGVLALDALASRNPDSLPQLVLLDHQMPGLDGLQVLERLRSQSDLHGLKVVMMTGCSNQIGFPLADESLLKPVDTEVLLTTIGRHAAA